MERSTIAPERVAREADNLRCMSAYSLLREALDQAKEDRAETTNDRGEGSLSAFLVDRLAEALVAADELIEQLAPIAAQDRINREAEEAAEDAAWEALDAQHEAA